MSGEITPHHLRALASDIEECYDPQSWADYCRAAAAMLEIKDARIAKLEAALRDVLPYVDTCNSSHREAQAKGYAALEGGKS